MNELSKIDIVQKTGDCCSWYEDQNNILKLQWGGFHEIGYIRYDGSEPKKYYEIYYSRYSKYVMIDEYGFFYGLFDCRKYDGVFCTGSFYIMEKNGRFGVIDADDNSVILHTCYNDIKYVSRDEDEDDIFVVATETGMFLYNQTKNVESDLFDEVVWLRYNNEYFSFKQGEKYGLIDLTGNVILPACYEYNRYAFPWREKINGQFGDYRFTLYVEDGLLNHYLKLDGETAYFPLKCEEYNHLVISLKRNKYGIMWNSKLVEDNILDEIRLRPRGKYSSAFSISGLHDTFVIAKIDGKFNIYDASKQLCVVSDCEDAYFLREKNNDSSPDVVVFMKGGAIGYVTTRGTVLDTSIYDTIAFFDRSYFMVSQDGKVGLLFDDGHVLFDCIYDKIERLNRFDFLLTKDGVSEEYIHERKGFSSSRNSYNTREPRHYDRFGGAFGYSDEDIDTIFDGDPSAYWNID